MGARERAKAAGIHNAHGAMTKAVAAGYDGPDIILDYKPGETGRISRSAHWSVWSPSHKTNPGGHWQDYGQQVFLVVGRGKHSEVKAETEQQARKWAAEKYGVTEWAKVPGIYGGPYFPVAAAQVIKRLIREAAS